VPEPERLRLESSTRGWRWVCGLGVATCGLSVFLLSVQPSWGMLGISLFWGIPGAFAVRWGAGGSRSWVAVTPESLVVRNALRTHTYPWSEVQGVEVIPASPDGRAITQAAVRLESGRRVPMSCTALAFGWAWTGDKRWRTVSDFIERLSTTANGLDRSQGARSGTARCRRGRRPPRQVTAPGYPAA
jgi:PH (Pleckstrin Homology) domain-containing protein